MGEGAQQFPEQFPLLGEEAQASCLAEALQAASAPQRFLVCRVTPAHLVAPTKTMIILGEYGKNSSRTMKVNYNNCTWSLIIDVLSPSSTTIYGNHPQMSR